MSETFIRPKEAAIESATHSQQIYSAIRNRRLRVQRRSGRLFIDRDSFVRWKSALEMRRKLAAEERAIAEATQ
jgi:hypothetical protein